MSLSRSLLFCSLLFSLLSLVSSGENLQVLHPASLASQFTSGGANGFIYVKPALFGIPPFLKVVDGVLVHAPDTPNGCDLSVSSTRNVLLNTYVAGSLRAEPNNLILLLERGGCTFVEKVLNAQNLSPLIKSVIVYDNEDHDYITVMGGENRNIMIPSMFTNRRNGLILAHSLAGITDRSPVSLRLSYSVPNPDGMVEIDFWSISLDKDSDYFRLSFGAAARRLGSQLLFTPHYFTTDGTLWDCYNNGGQRCGNQCTNNGRYCLPDPERNLGSGFSGMDIIRENVRQICLWRMLNQTGQNMKLFDYWERLSQRCTTPDAWATPACSYAVIDSLGLPSTAIARCIDESGGLDFLSNTRNSILDSEMARQREYFISSYPTTYVNNQPYYGPLYCPAPLEQATCGILQMTCQGYSAGTRPAACDSSISCPFGQNRDACGACGEGAANRPCSSAGDSGLPVYAIILIILSLCSVVALGVYLYMKRQQRRMKSDIDSLLRQYLPLDGPSENQSQINQIRSNIINRSAARSDETEMEGML